MQTRQRTKDRWRELWQTLTVRGSSDDDGVERFFLGVNMQSSLSMLRSRLPNTDFLLADLAHGVSTWRWRRSISVSTEPPTLHHPQWHLSITYLLDYQHTLTPTWTCFHSGFRDLLRVRSRTAVVITWFTDLLRVCLTFQCYYHTIFVKCTSMTGVQTHEYTAEYSIRTLLSSFVTLTLLDGWVTGRLSGCKKPAPIMPNNSLLRDLICGPHFKNLPQDNLKTKATSLLS